ncbi:MAG: hypothetical protein R3B06_01745 [Kofleriaceae bacterium]
MFSPTRRPRARRALLALGLALTLAAGCRSRSAAGVDKPPARRAFYFWRTTLTLAPSERAALAGLHVDTLYLRLFDVGWRDDGPTLLGPLVASPDLQLPAGLAVVPTVYITDEVWRHVDDAGVASVAALVAREVTARTARLGVTPRELQLDCDWTDTTRARYFAFLIALRGQVAAGTTLSATIRLHQVKYRERTGVPPVDRGMLMFYNMGRFSADPEARAIFDERAAARYLARLADYPLPLDGALPIWSWVIHLRDDVVEGLLQSTDPAELAGLDFLEPAGPDRYRATRATFLHGQFLRPGDLLKVEVTGPDETLAAATMLATHLAPTAAPRTIALFDLSERNLARHGLDSLDHAFQTAR